MLVFARRPEEWIAIGGAIKIKVLEIRGRSVRLGIDAPKQIAVVRGELIERELDRDLEVFRPGEYRE